MKGIYRADHVGSLLRPPELLQARNDFSEGKISRERLTEIEDASVLKALDLQKQAGISVFTEGEYRRSGWSTAVRDAIEGLVPVESNPTSAILGQWQGPHAEEATNVLRNSPGVMGAPMAAVPAPASIVPSGTAARSRNSVLSTRPRNSSSTVS